MRFLIPLILTAALAGCGGSYLQRPGTNPMGTNRLADTLAGRAVGAPQACLQTGPMWQSEMRDGTMAFRRGDQILVSTFEGECPYVGRLGYVLVTDARRNAMCQGDFAKFVDTSTGFVGTCVMGPFVPVNSLGKWR